MGRDACEIRARLEQHRGNLELWESGYLAPTEPDPEERDRVKDRLRVAIDELEWVLGGGGPTLDESDRQAVALGLAELAASRPGWATYLGEIAAKLGIAHHFDQLLAIARSGRSD